MSWAFQDTSQRQVTGDERKCATVVLREAPREVCNNRVTKNPLCHVKTTQLQDYDFTNFTSFISLGRICTFKYWYERRLDHILAPGIQVSDSEDFGNILVGEIEMQSIS